MDYDLQGEIIKYLNSPSIIQILQTTEFPLHRYANNIEIFINDIHTTDNKLKYFRGVKIIHLMSCANITDCGLKYLKGAHAVSFYNCDINGLGLRYFKNAKFIDISHCNNLTNVGLKFIKNVAKIIINDCNKITFYDKKKLKNYIVTPSDKQEFYVSMNVLNLMYGSAALRYSN